MNANKAWHEWDCVQIEMYIVKHGEKDIYYTLFQDIQDRQWYITYTYMLRLKSGERRA